MCPARQEKHLEALIPDSDPRIRPCRTTLYVWVTVALCLLLLGMAGFMFYMFPRPIDVSYLDVKSTSVSFDQEKRAVYINITATLDITNNNYYPIFLTNIKAQVVFSNYLIGKTDIRSSLFIKPLSESQVDYTLSTALNDDLSYMFDYCTLATIKIHNIGVEMQAVVVTVPYFGIMEENFQETYQYVDCGGNGTALFPDYEE